MPTTMKKKITKLEFKLNQFIFVYELDKRGVASLLCAMECLRD
jgi:hypothetical protein